MKNSPESPLPEIISAMQRNAAQPVAAPSLAESLLASEKKTLEKMANGASLSEVLNDLWHEKRPTIPKRESEKVNRTVPVIEPTPRSADKSGKSGGKAGSRDAWNWRRMSTARPQFLRL